jgi:hypothetical protein
MSHLLQMWIMLNLNDLSCLPTPGVFQYASIRQPAATR